MFRRQHDETPLPPPEPVTAPAAVATDPDPEPPKDDGTGHRTPAWIRWEGRQSIRRRERAAQLASIRYTTAQNDAVVAAYRRRDEARSTLQALREARAEVHYDLRNKQAARDAAEREGYAPMAAARPPAIVTLLEEEAELDRRIGRALDTVRGAHDALVAIEGAADADLERRRAALRDAS